MLKVIEAVYEKGIFKPLEKVNLREGERLTRKNKIWTQMNADNLDFKYKELTEEIIRIFYRVYNKLGYGFLEKVYENAMMIELKSNRY